MISYFVSETATTRPGEISRNQHPGVNRHENRNNAENINGVLDDVEQLEPQATNATTRAITPNFVDKTVRAVDNVPNLTFS